MFEISAIQPLDGFPDALLRDDQMNVSIRQTGDFNVVLVID